MLNRTTEDYSLFSIPLKYTLFNLKFCINYCFQMLLGEGLFIPKSKNRKRLIQMQNLWGQIGCIRGIRSNQCSDVFVWIVTGILLQDSMHFEPTTQGWFITTGKYCSEAFIWMVTLMDFIHRRKIKNYLVQHNKQYHRKVLLSSFHLNGHTLRFHPQTRKLEPPCTA